MRYYTMLKKQIHSQNLTFNDISFIIIYSTVNYSWWTAFVQGEIVQGEIRSPRILPSSFSPMNLSLVI